MRPGHLWENSTIILLMMTILLSSFSAVGEELDNITDGTIWGDLEVSDSVSSLAFVQTSDIPKQEKVYSSAEFGLTIWRLILGTFKLA